MANVLLFASIKEKLQQQSLSIPTTVSTIGELKSWLVQTYPEIEDDLEDVMWAKNEQFADETEQIEENDVIAIITPVSGG